MDDALDYNDPLAVRAASFCPCCGTRTSIEAICLDCGVQHHVVQDCGCSTCRYCLAHMPETNLRQLLDIAYAERQLFDEMMLSAGMGAYA